MASKKKPPQRGQRHKPVATMTMNTTMTMHRGLLSLGTVEHGYTDMQGVGKHVHECIRVYQILYSHVCTSSYISYTK
jgi:hypothetical protein